MGLISEYVKILWAPFFFHLFFFTTLFFASWFLVTRFYRHWTFHWQVPVGLGFLFSFGVFGNTMITAYQNKLAYDAQPKQADQASTQAQGQQQPAAPSQEEQAKIQAKQEFLKAIDALVQNPTLVTPDTKNQLFQKYAPILGADEKARKSNIHSLIAAYECQAHFLSDFQKSIEKKKVYKSSNREACQKVEGTFFGRDFLITAEMVKSNDDVIDKAVKTQRVPAADGKEQVVTAESIQASLDAQNKAVQIVKSILQQ
ncbi:MAG: hypothetical protein K2X47_13250 [Bdellovibrionales bacterium]|nr:hypothetical protein [Bdellovibrionales bacterium]